MQYVISVWAPQSGASKPTNLLNKALVTCVWSLTLNGLKQMCCSTNVADIDELSLSSPPFHTEWHLGSAILLCPVQGHESHAVHRVRPVPPHRHGWRVAHHPQHDCGRYLLRHVCGPRDSANPISGLISTAVPGEGESTWRVADSGVLGGQWW